ncbi:MAG: ABC transporter ATP-binding protein [Sphaerochaeta sp.]|jgi:iron complex transport system ATP-binding protein|nr:ABC transporter ATP-binding protein [Sphaerochaeta sp.]
MILDISGVSFSYKSTPVIEEITFSAGAGELVAILGRNGAGKTTLLKCLNRILRAQAGTVLVEGIDTRTMRPIQIARTMGWVPQQAEVSAMTVFDLVLLGRKPHFGWAPARADYQKVEEALHTISIEHLALRSADELSGGEFQQVQIARALAQDPTIILFDEPTSSLDIHNELRLMHTIRRVIHHSRRSALIAVHDLNLALRYCDRFILLKEGRIFAAGGRQVITEATIREVYDIDVRVIEVEGSPMVIPVQ